MPTTLVRNLAADLRPARRPARLLYAGAAAWLASGLVHLVAPGCQRLGLVGRGLVPASR